MRIEEIRQMGSEIGQWLKMRGYPIGIKLLKSKDEIPEGVIVPKIDLGYKLALCQALSGVNPSG